jgi:hypothetical protein
MLTIGKLAALADVRTDTLRYYEQEQLLAPASKSDSGYRLYDSDSVRRVRFIKRAQHCGFTLAVGDPRPTRGKRAAMTIPANVIAHLRTHAPHAYCDDCISQKLGPRTQQVQPITATLGLTPGFSRKSDFCRECGLKRQVINATPKRGAGK